MQYSDLRREQQVHRRAIAGVALWLVAASLTGKREPWDWMTMCPLAIAASAFLGYRFPDRPWRWALVLFESQFLAMSVLNGELGNLWPMAMLAR